MAGTKRRTHSRVGAGALGHDQLSGGGFDDDDDDEVGQGSAAGTDGTSPPAEYTSADGRVFPIIRIPIGEIVPHPWNPPSRSLPHPEDPEWVSLVRSIKTKGQKVPALLVTAESYLAQRDDDKTKEHIGSAKYVLVYGDRRRTAVLAAGVGYLLGVVDDSVLLNDQDLDAMQAENAERKGLTVLESAWQWKLYATELGLKQTEIAERMNVSQPIVARRLSLNLLTPEAQEALNLAEPTLDPETEALIPKDTSFTVTEAQVLAASLPYGPVMPWQKSPEPAQTTDERRTDQNYALALIRSGAKARKAVERVVAERQSIQTAARSGFDLVDPSELFGPGFSQHRVFGTLDAAAVKEQGLVAAIDEDTGTLAYYNPAGPASNDILDADDDSAADDFTDPVTDADTAPQQQSDGGAEGAEADETAAESKSKAKQDVDSRLRVNASKARRGVAVGVATAVPARAAIADLLIAQQARGVAVDKQVMGLALGWAKTNDLTVAETADEWAAEVDANPSRTNAVAWLVAIAAAEHHATVAPWNGADVVYLELLVDKAKYQPTSWEEKQLHLARRTSGA